MQLRGTAFESEQSRHFPYMVFIAKALHWASRVRVITCANSAGDNSKRVTSGSPFTTMKQEKENMGLKGSESGKPRCHIGP